MGVVHAIALFRRCSVHKALFAMASEAFDTLAAEPPSRYQHHGAQSFLVQLGIHQMHRAAYASQAAASARHVTQLQAEMY